MQGFWTRLAPWAVTAGLAFTAMTLGSRLVALRSENESLRTERMLAEVAYKLGQTQLAERTLLAENMINHLGGKLRRAEDLARLKVTALAAPAGFAKEAQGIIVWDPEQQAGLLTIGNLPAPGKNQDYQIWINTPAYPAPVSGSVFRVDSTGKAVFVFKPDQPVTQITDFAVSLETKGGAPAVGGPIVLLGR
jgi:hypothetical protein